MIGAINAMQPIPQENAPRKKLHVPKPSANKIFKIADTRKNVLAVFISDGIILNLD